MAFGQNWESNPGPLAPKARIIPLDQSAKKVHRPGLEPGTPAWKADMLTPTPTTQKSVSAGLEPARAKPNRFQVYLLNHSDTMSYIYYNIVY